MSDNNNVSADKYGMIPQQLPPYPAGANSARSASIAMQEQSVNKQMSLIGKGGSKKRKNSKKYYKLWKGGSTAQVVVPPANTPYPDIGNQTANNFKSTTQATINQNAQSAFDACVGKGPGCTAQVVQEQKAGTKRSSLRSRSKKGGVKWGCMSGGKRRKYTKKRHYKRRK
jgi:hypothetical protein